jgi:hypothetical protein
MGGVLRALAMVTLLPWALGSIGGCGSIEVNDDIPGQGEEGGACYPNGTCDQGLLCLSQLCVRPIDAGPGDIDASQRPIDAHVDIDAPDTDASIDASIPDPDASG